MYRPLSLRTPHSNRQTDKQIQMQEFKQSLIQELIKQECIRIGDFTLKSGVKSKYYFNMKQLIAAPSLIKVIGDRLYSQLGDFDIICGIPYGGLPIATYISVQYNKPLIYIRDKVKDYGMQSLIEGKYCKTDKCVILDDVMTTGNSLVDAIYTLRDKVNIVKTAVIFNRQQVLSPAVQCILSDFTPVSLLNKTDVVKFRLSDIQYRKQSKICFSADMDDIEQLTIMLNEIGPKLVICKIHFDAIPTADRETFQNMITQASIRHDFLIMEDRKFNDISHIVQKQYHSVEHWVDLVTVHALVSQDVIRSLSGAMIVCSMSNNSYDFARQATNLAITNEEHVVGFITQRRIIMHDEVEIATLSPPPPNKYKRFVCMTPGIHSSTRCANDQRYKTIHDVDTDIYIIGRGIYLANNPTEAIQQFLPVQDST